MAGVISVGGLVTGLDTNSIIDKLVSLERRPLDILGQQVATAQATKGALGSLSSKFLALSAAVKALRTTADVLVRQASSSDESVASAVAGSGAERGSATLTVTQLARGSVAGATVGRSAATDTVASGAGTFRFQVGSGEVQSVDVDATTTLQDLANAINGLNAGVTASAINAGTAASPDYRLQIQSKTTGESSTITVVQDDTQLAVQTAQTGQNALFTVSGFSTSFQRESNQFGDVLTGVTITLKSLGTSTFTVDDDADAITDKVKALVAAYNDLRAFVDSESDVTVDKDSQDIQTGALAANSTVRQVLDRLQEVFSSPIAGATTQYVNLSSLGIATQRDGSVIFTEGTFRTALGADPTAVAQVFAGNGTANGVANDLSSLIDQITGSDGAIARQSTSLDQQIQDLQDQIDEGERNIETFELSLRQQFASLETLVSSLQTQGDFLLSALRRSSL